MLRNIAAVAAAGLHPCRLHFALALIEIASKEKRLSAVVRAAWRMDGRGVIRGLNIQGLSDTLSKRGAILVCIRRPGAFGIQRD